MSNSKKICVVVTSLGKGGAERSVALLTKMLFNAGFQVYLVVILNDLDYEFEGELLNLGKLVKGHSYWSKIKKYNIFKTFLKTHNFDFVIDNRSRSSLLKEVMVSRLLFNPKNTIYCVRSYNFSNYFIKPKKVVKWLYKDAYKIVSVSMKIEEKIRLEYGFSNVETIYNPIEIINLDSVNIHREYILFYGRIVDDVKNISLLIASFRESQLPENGIDLIILGNGQDLDQIKQKVIALNLNEHVSFLPFIPNPFNYVKGAKFTVLSSHYEGFPRSIIESLAIGTPVVSVDCMSGPNEIIDNEINGLLVENYNVEALANAMNRLVFDKNLHQKCKANTKNSVDKFSMEIIGKKWHSLLN